MSVAPEINTELCFTNKVELYRSDNRYSHYRIPGMLVTSRGTLLAVCEARETQSDWSRMDILLRRSIDGGETFGAPILLAAGTENHPTVNNPVLTEDSRGRIHLLYCEDYAINGGRVLQRISEDDGVTWSGCRDITPSTEPDIRNVFALGPGHGIRTKNGTLLIPFWRVPKRYHAVLHSHAPSEIGILRSCDDGEAWQIGAVASTREGLFIPNETEIAELADGRIYLNTRLGAGLTYRGRAYSSDECGSWDEFEPDYTLEDPNCFGSCVACRVENKADILFFANCDSKTERNNVTLKGSTDGGRTWNFKAVIDELRGGYVELAADEKRGSLYVLYEEDYGIAQHLVKLDLPKIAKSFNKAD